ncbi:MAG: leucine-rich repeat domain-containing protein [Crocinitomicaceae bacterium]
MKRIAAVFCCLSFSSILLGQTKVYTSLEDAMSAPIDSVVYLDLSKQKLTEFPEEILNFIHLKSLNLSKNKLTVIPQEINELTQLKSINLEKNNLVYFPVGICALGGLEILNLGRNNIGLIPQCIGQLLSLKSFDIWDNPISDLPNNIQHLKSLEVMDLRGINFSSSKKKQISGLLPWVKIEFSAGCDCHGP